MIIALKHKVIYGFGFLLLITMMQQPLLAETKKTQTLRAKVYEKLDQARQLIENKQYAKAKQLIDKVKQTSKLNNFEQAQIANFLAFYYYEQDQYAQSLREYLKVIKTSEGLPSGLYNQTLYIIAQLYFEQENYQQALSYAQRWFNTSEQPPADAYLLIGQAHYMLKNYQQAIKPVKTGIDLYIKSNRQPKENWLLLLRAIYYDTNNYAAMLPVIKQLINYYPKTQYLLTLASIYGELGQQREMLGILESLYDAGHLNDQPKQLQNLASLYLYNDIPSKAAQLLETAFEQQRLKPNDKNRLLLAQAYASAKEYQQSIKPLKQLAQRSEGGKHDAALGYTYLSLGEWAHAEQAFKKALNKGQLKKGKAGDIWMSLGIAHLEQQNYSAAKAAMRKAVAFQEQSQAADNWLRFIEAEERRLKAINVNS